MKSGFASKVCVEMSSLRVKGLSCDAIRFRGWGLCCNVGRQLEALCDALHHLQSPAMQIRDMPKGVMLYGLGAWELGGVGGGGVWI